jgi:hypothetical protein
MALTKDGVLIVSRVYCTLIKLIIHITNHYATQCILSLLQSSLTVAW